MTVPRAFFALADPLVEQVTARARELESEGDAETLHKLRVALRQLRALWWAFAPLMDSALHLTETSSSDSRERQETLGTGTF
ncbi:MULTISPECIES: CHAD domain-containing protein [unclassified Caballeronia]|uniref:CHAD domain-containing protein n=1 Tax=Caballeronia sp. SBC1 TaxID=2705548 RepID=UPI0013EA4713